jgi:hypothetical protein
MSHVADHGFLTYLFIALEQYDAAPLVSGREVVASVVKFYGRDDVGYMRERHISLEFVPRDKGRRG